MKAFDQDPWATGQQESQKQIYEHLPRVDVYEADIEHSFYMVRWVYSDVKAFAQKRRK